MKIKIIEPYYYNPNFDVRSLTPNLGPIIIATLLKREGHRVEAVSEYVTNLDFDDINTADFVGISITTYNAKKGYQIAQQIEKPIVFGGFHASLVPEGCLEYGDYVIRGDGHSITKLANLVKDKNYKDLKRVPNLVYKNDNKVIYNDREARSINVVPDYSTVKDYYKFNLNRLLRVPLLVNASRGCYHNCNFCSIVEVYKGYKKKKKQVVLNDIKSQIESQHFISKIIPSAIWITDDNFFSDKQWAFEVLEEIGKLKKKYPVVIQMRVDDAGNERILKSLRQANVHRVYLGIESINQTGLDYFNKNASMDDITLAVEKIKRYGIDVYGLFVFGDDEFRRGDEKKIADFVIKRGLTGALIQPLTPFPGTKLYRRLKNEGRILHEEWQFYSGKVVFTPKHMTAAELQQEIYDCYRRIYSPLQLIKILFFRKSNLKLGVLGEAIFRYFENMKIMNYISEKLSDP